MAISDVVYRSKSSCTDSGSPQYRQQRSLLSLDCMHPLSLVGWPRLFEQIQRCLQWQLPTCEYRAQDRCARPCPDHTEQSNGPSCPRYYAPPCYVLSSKTVLDCGEEKPGTACYHGGSRGSADGIFGLVDRSVVGCHPRAWVSDFECLDLT